MAFVVYGDWGLGPSTRLSAMAQQRRSGGSDRGYEGEDKNPVWFKPVMFGLMLVGLAWILVYYISGLGWPVPSLGPWNIAVGFGIMFAGFLMTTRWR
jgi:hypothetical protein